MKYWYQEQLRVLETVLREADLADYDAEKVVSYMLDNGMNCIVVNAGGVMDFFPDATDFGRPNRFMNGRDFLKELIEACHREGIRVIARVDFRGVERERYEKHPDWFGQNADGTPLTGWNDRIIRPCYSAVYGREHAFEYMHNLMGRYALDGVWENCIVFGYGPCYCPKCRGAFRAATGKEIPEGPDYLAEEFKEYRTWKAGLARGHMHSMREIITALQERGIQTRAIWGLINEQLPYEGEETYQLEKAPYYASRILNLPCSTQITREEILTVCREVKLLLENLANCS